MKLTAAWPEEADILDGHRYGTYQPRLSKNRTSQVGLTTHRGGDCGNWAEKHQRVVLGWDEAPSSPELGGIYINGLNTKARPPMREAAVTQRRRACFTKPEPIPATGPSKIGRELAEQKAGIRIRRLYSTDGAGRNTLAMTAVGAGPPFPDWREPVFSVSDAEWAFRKRTGKRRAPRPVVREPASGSTPVTRVPTPLRISVRH